MVIVIMTGAFLTASLFAVLPSPQQVSPINLNKLALTTLETLNAQQEISTVAFETTNDTAWNQLQVALSASLPSNIVYNLTAYDISSTNGLPLYTLSRSISNAASLGVGAEAATYTVASSNVTFTVTPQKIGVTLYILNCSDSNGWWITGNTPQTLAGNLANLLSPYFQPSSVVMVQNTAQLGQIMNNQSLGGESVSNAIVINTCGEAVPIPQSYAIQYSSDLAHYCYQLGKCVNMYNWTWVSIVGWPFYYVTNTLALNTTQNTWGIYGMNCTASQGLNAFLEGIDCQPYVPNTSSTGSPGVVTLTSAALNNCSYYGIFPSPNQTSTRALPTSIESQFNLTVQTLIFNPVNNYIPGAVFNHVFSNGTNITGSLFTLGVTRLPDIRLAALGILCTYNPTLYKSQYTAAGTSKLVVLQLGLAGGQ